MKNQVDKFTILLVDDNEVDNYIHERIIQITGIAEKTIVKNSGKSALEYLEENQDQSNMLPDIIFLDINMPVVDGFVFLHEFANFPELVKGKCRIHILSSSSNEDDIRQLIDNKFVVKYHLKPLQEEVLEDIKKSHVAQ